MVFDQAVNDNLGHGCCKQPIVILFFVLKIEMQCYTQLVTPANFHRQPLIVQRLLMLSLLCAVIPLCTFGILVAITHDSNTFEPVANTISTSASNQLQLGVKANATRISSRMGQMSYSVKQLKHFAEEILGNQSFYGGAIPVPTDQVADQNEIEAPLDNTLYYSLGEDGAIRRLVNDGSPSAFFADRDFSSHDLQRLYASAALDPFLVSPCLDEPLCGRTFFITTDNLVRTFPYYNFAHWDGGTEISKPRDYWSATKADEGGIVWTSPYQSLFDEQWVVACLAQVTLGGRTMGVVGCEMPLKPLADNLLVFSLGTGGMAWVVKPGGAGENEGWWTISTQPGAEDFLRVVPVASAALPTDKHPQSEILLEADLAIHSPEAVSSNLDSLRSGTDRAIEIGERNGGELLASYPIETTGWLLCGTIRNDANRAALVYAETLQSSFSQKIVLFLLSFLVAVGLAIFFARFESRKISLPLALLTQLVVKAKSDPNVSITEFSNLGEINSLTTAIRDLALERQQPTLPLEEVTEDGDIAAEVDGSAASALEQPAEINNDPPDNFNLPLITDDTDEPSDEPTEPPQE